MLRIGLTGGIGSGKSTVAAILERMGFPVFYSDHEAKALYTSNQDLKRELTLLCGADLYTEAGFNKEMLRLAVFENPALKAKIESLVHPMVRIAFNTWASQQKSKLVFNEAAILFETGAYEQFDATILITAPLTLRKHRIEIRDGISAFEIEKRLANQWPDARKIILANFIIENDGRPILKQIEQIIDRLLKV